MQFSRSRARKVLEKENQFFHRWRGLRSRSQETEELIGHRIDAVACIEAAKYVYMRYKVQNRHDPGNYSLQWTKFADAVVGQILKVDPNFARTPMVLENSKGSQPRATGESGASGNRLPTPPAPPPGAAVTANRPTPPPGPARAEQEQEKHDEMMVYSGAHAEQPEAYQEQSSPAVEPSE
eukprot:9252296-Pyramimonas_sp.AAC.1